VLLLPLGKNKVRRGVSLDVNTAHRVDELATAEKRSGSAMLAILISEALECRSKTQHGFVRGAEYYQKVAVKNDDSTG
jgi:predicted transcriptional regulator